MRGDYIERVLDAIELAEYPLLAWGVTNSSFSEDELTKLISKTAPECDVVDCKRLLIERGLIFETPTGTYRSRIAEFLHLASTLRQWFREKKSTDAQLLVHDFKYLSRPRSFPRRDILIGEVVSRLKDESVSFREDILKASAPEYVSGFQARAIQEILQRFSSNSNSSLVVTAGTGSGKTNAYFIPMLNWITEVLAIEGHRGTRVLALYPRIELLKDQLANALIEVRKINQILVSRHLATIRVGVWYGDVPHNLKSIRNPIYNWRKLESGHVRWVCPILRCIVCKNDLSISDSDITRNRSLLSCENENCSFVIDSSELIFTRDPLKIVETCSDIVFTTTESLNLNLASNDGDVAFGLSSNSALRSVLVDEAHVYGGMSGSQVAFLFRRLRKRVGHALSWVSLSATLENPLDFISDLVGIDTIVITPQFDEMIHSGSEYIVAVRHYLESKKSPLSTAIQMAMLLSRTLDWNRSQISKGFFGSKLFLFGDKLDVINRLYFYLADAEGHILPKAAGGTKMPSSLATLRSADQNGVKPAEREPAESRFDDGQWWKMCEDIGHPFFAASHKIIGRTSSQQRGVQKDADIIVATASLEVGFDDPSVGAILQYKVPRESSSFLQRKGRAGRTQKMRPITAIVLSPFGADRAAWTNAENQLFAPLLPARRLPLSNRYTQKMQAGFVLLDWLHSEIGVSDSGKLLSGGRWTEHLMNDRSKAIQGLNSLLFDADKQRKFETHLSDCLCLFESQVREILWSQPRGLLSTVVPTALRRLEDKFKEDGGKDISPLREFLPRNLFSELQTPDVYVEFLSRSNQNRDPETLPVQRVIREFAPGNSSRHFGKESTDRHWVPIDSNLTTIDVVTPYGARDTGITAVVEGASIRIFRPQRLELTELPPNFGDGTTSFPVWGVQFETLGSPSSFPVGIDCWGTEKLVLEAFLHSKSTHVLVTRFATRSLGWTSPTNGDPERIDVSFVNSEEPVGLGFELEVDGICLDLARPDKRPDISIYERAQWLENRLKHDGSLATVANDFDLGRIVRGLIYLMAEQESVAKLLAMPIAQFYTELLASIQVVSIDPIVMQTTNMSWLNESVCGQIHAYLLMACGSRDESWNVWFDKRIMTALASAILDSFRELISDLDSDDLVVDVIIPNDETDRIQAWITESSGGGNGSIERISEGLSDPTRFERLFSSLLRPREFESLALEIKKLINFATGPGEDIANMIRESWLKDHKSAQMAIQKFSKKLESSNIFVSRSALSVFMNRLLGPGARPGLLEVVSNLSDDWDQKEFKIGFEIPSEVFGLLHQNDSKVDADLHLSNPLPGRRSSAVSTVMWTRSTQGLDLDYEVSNPYDFGMTMDVPALRSMVTLNAIDRIEADARITTNRVLETTRSNVEVSGTSEVVKRAILEAIVQPLEDDAIWIYRHVGELSIRDGNPVITLRGDFELL